MKGGIAVIRDLIKNGFFFLDGAMGTVIQQRGINAGKHPDLLYFSEREAIMQIHRDYVNAGSNLIYTNTFGTNKFKLEGSGKTVREVVTKAVAAAREAAQGKAFVGVDVGPLGQMLEPLGTLSFEDAYEAFKEVMLSARDAGADMIAIETMTDLYEVKAALLAAKENTDLPVFVSMSFEKNGRTFTGCTAESFARTVTALGADAIGLNCSMGPDDVYSIIKEIAENTFLPVIAKPNGGLPDPITGKFSLTAESFAQEMMKCIEAGASVVGGCCGTSPDHIRKLKNLLENKEPVKKEYKKCSAVCTPQKTVRIDGVRVIGERINPTGKKRFQQALLENDIDFIVQLGVQQADAGAEILDVNVGYPGVDEKTMLPQIVKKLQSVLSLPLQLDSTNPEALEAGLRVYNGKPAVNSVNGEAEVMDKILPLVKKYGASVVGLTLDGNGVPKTAEQRFEIAERIHKKTREYGIPDEDLWIDCLTLTVSAQQEQAGETLKALSRVKNELGLKTLLGVSNISFGMPNRSLVTSTFLSQALYAGLDMPIINPNLTELMNIVYAHRVLSGEDKESKSFVELFAGQTAVAETAKSAMTLEQAVMRGLKKEASELAKTELETSDEINIIQNKLIPALDKVGSDYESGKAFLPQLLSSAQAAQGVFDVIKLSLESKGGNTVKKGKIAVATVKGDIHDIGKNIVKTILENYGYEVFDLGKDISPEDICAAVNENDIHLIGLSALMTTTLPAMEQTVKMLHEMDGKHIVWVGGAVVTESYAKSIGADYYAKDARKSVEIAKKELG